MKLTAEEIERLCAAGNAVRVAADGSFTVRPVASMSRPMTATERTRKRRERLRKTANETPAVSSTSENETNETNETQKVSTPSPPLSPPTPSPLAPTPTRINAREEAGSVEAIYAAYPRKVGKPKALPMIRKALANPPLGVSQADWPAQLLAITQRYAALRNGEDPNFTPHPATWFHQRRFEDDPSTWKPAPANGIHTQPNPRTYAGPAQPAALRPTGPVAPRSGRV